MMQQQQALVRFQNRTHVVQIPSSLIVRDISAGSNNDYQNHTKADSEQFVSWKAFRTFILQQVSNWSGWQLEVLQFLISNETDTNLPIAGYSSVIFCTVRVRSCVQGGKGGFGTLLKGQSRQAGAKATTNFGACRDLQGRRLQHINDAIQYTIWKEWNDKVTAGTATKEQMVEQLLFKSTPTGVMGYYLPNLPAWADVSSKKEFQKQKKIFYKWKRENQLKEKQRREEKEMRQGHIDAYIQLATNDTEQVTNTVSSAFQKGMLLRQQKLVGKQTIRKRAIQEISSTDVARTNTQLDESEVAALYKEDYDDKDRNKAVANDPPSAILTLSGDFVFEYQSTTSQSIKIQSKSNFATIAILIDRENFEMCNDVATLSATSRCCYYEVSLLTMGINQIGWSVPDKFQPNSSNGDGVGDCSYSWAFDFNRRIKLHNSTAESYFDEKDNQSFTKIDKVKSDFGTRKNASEAASSNDTDSSTSQNVVIGCLWDPVSGEISFSIDGKDGGIAFKASDPSIRLTNDDDDQKQQHPFILYPSISCNENEIIELRLEDSQFQFKPSTMDVIPVGRLMSRLVDDGTVDSISNDQSMERRSSENFGKNPDLSLVTSSHSHSDLNSNNTIAVMNTNVEKEAMYDGREEQGRLDLDQYSTSDQLEELGLDRLRNELMALGVKYGGTLQERAQRLLSLKGLSYDQYPTKVLASSKKDAAVKRTVKKK